MIKLTKNHKKGVLPIEYQRYYTKKMRKIHPRNIRILFFENKIRGIEEMETYLKQLTHKFILGMIKSYLEALDKAIVETKQVENKKGYN